jgi:hypothetical protein
VRVPGAVETPTAVVVRRSGGPEWRKQVAGAER